LAIPAELIEPFSLDGIAAKVRGDEWPFVEVCATGFTASVGTISGGVLFEPCVSAWVSVGTTALVDMGVSGRGSAPGSLTVTPLSCPASRDSAAGCVDWCSAGDCVLSAAVFSAGRLVSG
jgi:hypothetical protein